MVQLLFPRPVVRTIGEWEDANDKYTFIYNNLAILTIQELRLLKFL